MLWEWSLLHLSWAVPFRKAAHKCTCTDDGCSSVPGAECLWNTRRRSLGDGRTFPSQPENAPWSLGL